MVADTFAEFSAAHGGTSRPFDAWTVREGEVEPHGSHATLDAALRALASEPEGGGVFVGRKPERWTDGVSPIVRRAILTALRVERSANERGWTDEQEAVFAHAVEGPEHLIVRARAGSGKTTALVEILKRLPRDARVLMLAFNVEIMKELQQRAPGHVKVRTSHGHGYQLLKDAWGKGLRVAEPREARMRRIVDRVLPAKVRTELAREDLGHVRQFVSFAKAFLARDPAELAAVHALHPAPIPWGDYFDLDTEAMLWDERDLYRWTAEILAATTARDGEVDFDDMVFVPAALDLRGERFDFVLVDEVQDWNRAQVRLARLACAKGGRIVAVGDDRQAIYSWRGADPESMPRLRDELAASPRGVRELGLSVTWRCARAIVAVAQQEVPDLRPAPAAVEGEVVEVGAGGMDLRPGDFVISRVNAPLVPLALGLLQQGRRARIQGRDIGKSLAAMVRDSRAATAAEFLSWLARWEAAETLKLRALANAAELEGHESLAEKYTSDAAAAKDKADVLRALAERADGTASDLVARIESLFSDAGAPGDEAVVFTSCHRAKGLEADRVWVLKDTFRLGRDGREPPVEERNLWYVAVTRARRSLFLARGAA